MKKNHKCYLYTRVSTAIQVDGYSLDAQKDKLRKYAEYQDMTIVSEFSDEGFSGKNIKGRPEFTRMMEKIESGEDDVDFVLVHCKIIIWHIHLSDCPYTASASIVNARIDSFGFIVYEQSSCVNVPVI